VELLLPVVALVALFGGIATPVEARGRQPPFMRLSLKTFFLSRLQGPRDVARVMAECGLLCGGVLLILGVATGIHQLPD